MSDSSIDAKLASIASLTEELLAHRRLIIASNRGPLEHKIEPDGSLTAGRGSGGMVTALLATARFVPMTWVASAMTDGDRRRGPSPSHSCLQCHSLGPPYVDTPSFQKGMATKGQTARGAA